MQEAFSTAQTPDFPFALVLWETEQQPGPYAHCAWCGDPPDAFGSHGICADHAAELIEAARVRRTSRAVRVEQPHTAEQEAIS
jgi:hypothetical protein